jgi:hypothetical protein
MSRRNTLVHTPGPDDILLGWETRDEDHSGNLRLKELIKERAEEYISSDYANAKVMIVRQVAEELTEDGGRFLCKSVDSGNAWIEAQRDYILENIKQAFRETVSSMPRKVPSAQQPTTVTSTVPTPSVCTIDSNDRECRRSPSLSSMERSHSNSVTVTPPSRLSPVGRLQQHGLSTKEILLRRIAQQQQQQQQVKQQQQQQISQRTSLSPLDEATRRRKLHMAKMQAMLLQKRQEELQLMTLLRDHPGRSGANDAFSLGSSSGYLSGQCHHHYAAEAMGGAHLLPSQLRLTPLGTRRQLDPLAPNRKRKRGSAIM